MTSQPHAGDGALEPDVEAWLRAGAGEGGACDKVVETSISWLFFFPGRVLKLKKPVDFGFVDFTTLDKRRWAAERELAFNRVTAPSLYRRLIEIRRAKDRTLDLGGEGEILEVAVEMRRFGDDAILSGRLPLDGAFAEALGRQIARLHQAAPRAGDGAGEAGLRYVLDSNAAQLRAFAEPLGSRRIADLIAASDEAFEAVRGLLNARAADGFRRACHGDLHLSNIIVEDGAPLLFDCIDFSDRLRQIDVEYDIAFLLMDLAFRGAREGANRAFNGWLDEAARGFPPTLWSGLAALPLFQSVRATVRAHVSAREGRLEDAELYLAAAKAHLETPPPRLLAVGGLSGSGKTTFARRIAPALGGPPGAVVLRSDEVRKRLWGARPTDRLGAQAYGSGQSARVYAAVAAIAEAALRAGASVVIDAAFLEETQRAAIQALAAAAGVPFEGVWMEAPPDVLRDRISARRDDASDADLAVLEGQLRREIGDIAWPRRRMVGAEPL
jgi:aminoglycoside phosphotransferase family enzyme/predicted kinase